MFRRLWCLLTLGHDPDFSRAIEMPGEILFRFPCRKCDQPLAVHVWARAEGSQELYALAVARAEPGHTDHCNKRRAWGDGFCECGKWDRMDA